MYLLENGLLRVLILLSVFFFFIDNELVFQISYRIRSMGPDHDKFVIDPITGVVRTAVTFDREKKNEYYITLIAEDGAKSDRPNHYPPNTPNKGTIFALKIS